MTTDVPHPSQGRRADATGASVARLLSEASAALSQGNGKAAEHPLGQVLALHPQHADANRLMGIALQMQGDYGRAIGFLRRAIAAAPANALLHTNLGSALFESGAVDDALAALRRACELAPNMAASWYNLGKALKLQFHVDEASKVLQRSLQIDPNHIRARITLADIQASLGDVASAVANYREILRQEPANPSAWFALGNLKTEPFSASDVAQLQCILKQPGASADARILIGFALAKAHEDQNDYAAAFDALAEANALKRKQVQWDAAGESAHVDAIARAFAEALPPSLDPALGKEVIFIVSLPRSGSTLTEQILASHPLVEGANEITDLPQVIEDESKRRGVAFPAWVSSATADDWHRLGLDYLARTERWRRQRPIFTDKNLLSWQLVGAIRAMLPGARLVNNLRDPLETCFACYRQLFSTGAHFTYDVSDMTRSYADYDRLSRHWQQLFPQHIHTHVYEELLANPELQTRKLLDFCGLAFDPRCLAFHETSRAVRSTPSAAQVRQPLRSDTSRSGRYGDKLDPMRAQLAQLLPNTGNG